MRLEVAGICLEQAARLPRTQGPDERDAAVRQRQQRQRATLDEALPGGVLVWPGRPQLCHDGGLFIACRARLDAEGLAYAGTRAIGTDDQLRRKFPCRALYRKQPV